MLYLESQTERGKGWSRVFSDTDNERELTKFRCMVRAHPNSLHVPKDKDDRLYLTLYGDPRARAVVMLPKDLQFPTSVERVQWELNNLKVKQRHPQPFLK
jgi:hypothetical protein